MGRVRVEVRWFSRHRFAVLLHHAATCQAPSGSQGSECSLQDGCDTFRLADGLKLLAPASKALSLGGAGIVQAVTVASHAPWGWTYCQAFQTVPRPSKKLRPCGVF